MKTETDIFFSALVKTAAGLGYSKLMPKNGPLGNQRRTVAEVLRDARAAGSDSVISRPKGPPTLRRERPKFNDYHRHKQNVQGLGTWIRHSGLSPVSAALKLSGPTLNQQNR
jgi:hypothetical protein